MPQSHGFTARERTVFRRLNQPWKIQRFLDEEIGYDKEPDGPRCRSPRQVLTDRVAHCMSGALFAAAALRMIGHPPLLLDLEAVRATTTCSRSTGSAAIGERLRNRITPGCASANRSIAVCANW